MNYKILNLLIKNVDCLCNTDILYFVANIVFYFLKKAFVKKLLWTFTESVRKYLYFINL